MNQIWSLQTIDSPAKHVLQHWQAFQVRPTDICYIPLPGPSFAVFAGLVDYTGYPEITAKVVAFDPLNRMLSTWSGETYSLGPDSGFTPDMQHWYRQRMAMAAAGARNVTGEVLSLLEVPPNHEIHSTTSRSRGLK